MDEFVLKDTGVQVLNWIGLNLYGGVNEAQEHGADRWRGSLILVGSI